MKTWGVIRRQSVDFFVYLALPLASVFLPAAWSRSLLARSSNFNWVLSTEAEAAWSSASKYVDTGDEKTWKARWKQVEMLDVRDCYLMSFGRTGSVLAEVECDSSLVDAWVDLGKAYRDRGEPDEAERCFREALCIDPVFFWHYRHKPVSAAQVL